MTIDHDEWAAIAAHLDSLETQVADLTAQVEFLARERLLYVEGREALERATNPSVDLLAPLPAGPERGCRRLKIGEARRVQRVDSHRRTGRTSCDGRPIEAGGWPSRLSGGITALEIICAEIW